MKSTRVDGKSSACRSGFLLIWSIRFPGGFSITSALLFWSRSTRELSFGTIVIFTFLTFGCLPYQYGLTVRSTSLSLFSFVTMKGPPLTGLSKNFAPCAFTSFAGTIAYAYIARSASSGACGSFKVITSVCALGAVTLLTESSRNPQPPLKFIERTIEKRASSAVSGEPSENLAARRWKVYVSPSFEIVHDFARSGWSVVPAAFDWTSRL